MQKDQLDKIHIGKNSRAVGSGMDELTGNFRCSTFYISTFSSLVHDFYT